MKKLIAAAVASSMTAFAMADISITGDAKYEYDLTDNAGTKTTTANTEAHLNFTGKSGDTTFVAKFEMANSDAGAMDLEDSYISTSVAGVGIKAGNYASGTSGLAGEIEEGSRSHGKVTLSYKLGDISMYAGNGGASSAGNDVGVNNNMFAGASTTVAGQTIHIKKASDTRDNFGISGNVGGVSYRYENIDQSTTSTYTAGEADYIELSGTMNGITVQYAKLDADNVTLLEETDSAVFALEAGLDAYDAKVKEQDQIAVSTTVDGTKVTVKSGTLKDGISAGTDVDYTQIGLSRKLASGATAVITYTDNDASATTSKENLEIELNVAF
jgi:hypothetical protein